MKEKYLKIDSKKPLDTGISKGNIKNIDKSISLVEFYHVLTDL